MNFCVISLDSVGLGVMALFLGPPLGALQGSQGLWARTVREHLARCVLLAECRGSPGPGLGFLGLQASPQAFRLDSGLIWLSAGFGLAFGLIWLSFTRIFIGFGLISAGLRLTIALIALRAL